MVPHPLEHFLADSSNIRLYSAKIGLSSVCFYAFTEGEEFYKSQGLQRITLDCKSNKYYTRSNDFGGMREVEYGKQLDIENESTFGKWVSQICNGESEIFKKIRRGTLKLN